MAFLVNPIVMRGLSRAHTAMDDEWVTIAELRL